MRYSRFKKQMEGNPGPKKPRGSGTPRKKVEKNKKSSPKKMKHEAGTDDESRRIKMEHGGRNEEVGDDDDSAAPTPEAGSFATSPSHSNSHSHSPSPYIKHEPNLRSFAGYPMTPLGSASQTPSPGFGDESGSVMNDEMLGSFSAPGHAYGHDHENEGLYAAHPSEFGMGMGHMGDVFGDMWQAPQQCGEGGVLVKREPRWEEGYHHQV